MTNSSVDDFRAYVAAHVESVETSMQAAILKQGQLLAAAINAAAPKGASGRLETSAQANFADPQGMTTNFRTFTPVAKAAVAPHSDTSKVVVTAGGSATTKPEKHGKAPEYDYALATEFGTGRERAKPFFYPTFNAMKGQIEAALAQEFGESQILWDEGYRPGVSAGSTSGSARK